MCGDFQDHERRNVVLAHRKQRFEYVFEKKPGRRNDANRERWYCIRYSILFINYYYFFFRRIQIIIITIRARPSIIRHFIKSDVRDGKKTKKKQDAKPVYVIEDIAASTLNILNNKNSQEIISGRRVRGTGETKGETVCFVNDKTKKKNVGKLSVSCTRSSY